MGTMISFGMLDLFGNNTSSMVSVAEKKKVCNFLLAVKNIYIKQVK